MNIEIIEKEGNMNEIYGIKTSKTFRNYMNSKIKHFVVTNNKEMEMVMKSILNAYDKFHPEIKSDVILKSWKNKSTFEVIKKPDYFEVTTYQKESEYVEPKEIKTKIQRYEIECLLNAFKGFVGLDVKTKEIAREYCILTNLRLNSHNKPLFEDGIFSWDRFFSDRSLHMKFNIMLRLLAKLGFIEYMGGKSRVISDLDLQSIFS